MFRKQRVQHQKDKLDRVFPAKFFRVKKEISPRPFLNRDDPMSHQFRWMLVAAFLIQILDEGYHFSYAKLLAVAHQIQVFGTGPDLGPEGKPYSNGFQIEHRFIEIGKNERLQLFSGIGRGFVKYFEPVSIVVFGHLLQHFA